MEIKYGLLKDFSGSIDVDKFRKMVAVNAYYRAEKKGFQSGYETAMKWMTGLKPRRILKANGAIDSDKLRDVVMRTVGPR